jgi:radical SAM protein with 4Fe4S-binding SPASM domain
MARTLASVRSFFSPSQVGYVIFYVTNRCNFRCPFCFYNAEIEKGLKPDELTLDEIRKIAPTIGPLLQLSLTGGEPFLRKDFEAVTEVLLEATGASYVTIPTNASMPERMERYLRSMLKRFPDTDFRICFSIEGVGEEHDQLRRMPGSFETIKESYELLSPLREEFPNLVLDSNSVFTAESENTILGTLKYISENFGFDNVSITYARGVIKDPNLKTNSRKLYEEANDFLESLRRTKERRFLYPVIRGVRDVSREVLIRTVFDDEFVVPCKAGRKLVVIGETGDVFPCEILGKAFGNLRDTDFDLKKLLATSETAKLNKWIKDTKCKCSFECALAANVAWSPSLYPKLLASSIKNIG